MSQKSHNIRLLIVEDNIALAENLYEFFGNKNYTLDFARDGLTGLHLAVTYQYDVIVLDVMLPGIDGFEICRRLRNDLNSQTPIIFLTAKDAIEDKEIGFESGVDDYLTKPFNMRELDLRLQALTRRKFADNNNLTAGDVTFDPGTLRVSCADGRSVVLTGIGANLFEILIRAYPNYVSHQTIIETIWGDDFVDPHTLRSHVSALRKVLKVSIGTSLVQSMHGKGYLLNPELES